MLIGRAFILLITKDIDRKAIIKKDRNTMPNDLKLDFKFKICLVEIINPANIQNWVRNIIGIIKSGVTAKNLSKPGAWAKPTPINIFLNGTLVSFSGKSFTPTTNINRAQTNHVIIDVRPDMAYFKFTKNILAGKKIDIYNKGKMYRDYTYVDDIVDGIYKLSNKVPSTKLKKKFKNDSLSSVAPFRILNIGNTKKIYLLDFINTLEKELGKKIKKHYMPMQKGDVYSTLSDNSLLKRITGYNPKTNYKVGIKKFINWYLDYYN